MDPRLEEAQELVTSLKTKCQLRKEKMLRKELEGGKRGNNNDEDFKSNYATSDHHRSSTGRLSSNSASNSNESAFSSASSDGDDSEDQSLELASSSSSGRSSANRSVDLSHDSQQTFDEADQKTGKQINTVCNVAPNNRLALEMVERVRQKFLESSAANSDDDYEQEDLLELKNVSGAEQHQTLSFRLISRYINFKEMQALVKSGDESALEKALSDSANRLKELLLFRHQYRLNHVLDDHFSKEIHMLHGIFPFGYDKNHLPVLYLRARVHRKWSRELDDAFRRYVAWQVNVLTKSYAGAQAAPTVGRNGIEKDGSFGICFDCLNVSYSCVDMDFLSYLVKILVNYYPTYCRYALCVDLPWLFRSVWKMVRSWLPEDARNTVYLITSKQLTDYIDEDQIPNSIKVNDLAGNEKPDHLKHRKPENFDSLKTIDDFAKDLQISSSELKQFKSHYEKVCKEYEQLGAI